MIVYVHRLVLMIACVILSSVAQLMLHVVKG